MEFDDILNHLGLTRKEKPKYLSVLEERSMENPTYRQHLEQQQGLEHMYPELALLGRGSLGQRSMSMAEKALKPPSGPSVIPEGLIGSRVPKNYIPFTELPPWEQQIKMLRAQGRSRAMPADLGALLKETENMQNRTGMNLYEWANRDRSQQ